jgi:hypothetical protein
MTHWTWDQMLNNWSDDELFEKIWYYNKEDFLLKEDGTTVSNQLIRINP